MDQSFIKLDGQKILITGVSRSLGIGATLSKRLAEAGAQIAAHGSSDYDLEVGHRSAMRNGTETLSENLQEMGLTVIALTSCDLKKSGAAEQVVTEAAAKIGTLDGLILNHAYSTCAPIGNWTEEHIDSHLLVNVRASMLMIQSFANQVDVSKGGTITLFTSGQYLGPMVDEISYAISKDAIIGLCKQCAVALAEKNIRVNCVNPGPNDTGYMSGEAYETVAKMFPSGRWGTPNDTANLVLFLHSEYATWITGQVIASEGGFRRM